MPGRVAASAIQSLTAGRKSNAFSLVTLLAAQLSPKARGAVMNAASYHKRRPTFSNTLAAVRRHFWQEQGFAMSRHPGKAKKLRPALQEDITYALCHAAWWPKSSLEGTIGCDKDRGALVEPDDQIKEDIKSTLGYKVEQPNLGLFK